MPQFSPRLYRTIRRLIEDEGKIKVRSIISSTSLPAHVLGLTEQYVEVCAAFRSNGTDA